MGFASLFGSDLDELDLAQNISGINNMYGKCRKVEVAQRIFDEMPKKNLVCWNAMIVVHCIHGNPKDGLSLFDEMVNGETICPDEVTSIGVLSACFRPGLPTEGAGFDQEAVDILRSKPKDDRSFSSESLMWANLLSLCRFQANTALGERIAKALIDMEPENFSHYQLLLNVYAAAGQWDDVERVKEMVKKKGIGRIPGCNLVEMKNIVHHYEVRHHWQEEMREIGEMIGGMS